jgi:hypothetical protein
LTAKIDMNCCKNPAQYNMQEYKYTIGNDGTFYKVPCLNRICTNCYTHWYGPPENLIKYSRNEWDKMINKAFD